MKRARWVRTAIMFFSGAMVLQSAGCIPSAPDLLSLANTILLGVTAAGSLAILQNI